MRNGLSSIEARKESWGRTQKIWEAALQRVMAAIPDNRPNAESALLLEYGKLYWPTVDLPHVKQHLEELANQITANASSATSETNWLRLSSILSHFAAAC
jgi:hypothetical protein